MHDLNDKEYITEYRSINHYLRVLNSPLKTLATSVDPERFFFLLLRLSLASSRTCSMLVVSLNTFVTSPGEEKAKMLGKYNNGE